MQLYRLAGKPVERAKAGAWGQALLGQGMVRLHRLAVEQIAVVERKHDNGR